MTDPHATYPDAVEGRPGHWMQTSLGGRFFPMDPRVEDVYISDIANGLALDCRYAGQGRVDKFYSVAEHCCHMVTYAATFLKWPAEALLATLLHDAAEAYCNDLPRAVKHAVNNLVCLYDPTGEAEGCDAYSEVEDAIQVVIDVKFNIENARMGWAKEIKEMDQRMIPSEKAAIMRHSQLWAHDKLKPLEGVEIQCWSSPVAKEMFLNAYTTICRAGGFKEEGYEI